MGWQQPRRALLYLLQLLCLLQLLHGGGGSSRKFTASSGGNHGSRGSSSSSGSNDSSGSSSRARAPAATREESVKPHQPARAYAVIIDAGSSGSRAHVYTYLPPHPSHGHSHPPLSTSSHIPAASAHLDGARARAGSHGSYGSGNYSSGYGGGYNGGYARVQLPGSEMRIGPGLSAYAPSGNGAGQSLEPLLEYARQQVPRVLWHRTPVHVMATAGLRLLPRNQSAAILDNCRAVLAASGFAFKPSWARVLSGTEEGLFAWVAVNYAAGTLQALASSTSSDSGAATSQALNASAPGTAAGTTTSGSPLQAQTYGVLELGGASMQVTFQLPAAPLNATAVPPWQPHTHSLQLPGLRSAHIFSHSLLGFGMDTAFARAAGLAQRMGSGSDPCMLRGSTSSLGLPGAGSFRGCLNITRLLLQPASLDAVASSDAATQQLPVSIDAARRQTSAGGGLGDDTVSLGDVASTAAAIQQVQAGSDAARRQTSAGGWRGDHTASLDAAPSTDAATQQFSVSSDAARRQTSSSVGQGSRIGSLGAVASSDGATQRSHVGSGGTRHPPAAGALQAASTKASRSAGVGQGSYGADGDAAEARAPEEGLGLGSYTAGGDTAKARAPEKGVLRGTNTAGRDAAEARAPEEEGAGTGSGSHSSERLRRVLAAPASCGAVDCSFDAEALPPITGLHLAMENFFHTAQRLQLAEQPTLRELAAAGSAFCDKPWSEAEEQYVKGKDEPREYVAKTCFGAAYIYTLLHDVLRITPDQRRLVFTNSVWRPQGSGDEAEGAGKGRLGEGQGLETDEPERVEVNWPLGAMLVEVAQAPHPSHSVQSVAHGGHAHGSPHQRQHQLHMLPRQGSGQQGSAGGGGQTTVDSGAAALAGTSAAAGALGQASATARLRAGVHATRPKQRHKGKPHMAAAHKGPGRGRRDDPGPAAAATATPAAAGLASGVVEGGDEQGEGGEYVVIGTFVGQPFVMALLLLLAVGAASAVSISRLRPPLMGAGTGSSVAVNDTCGDGCHPGETHSPLVKPMGAQAAIP